MNSKHNVRTAYKHAADLKKIARALETKTYKRNEIIPYPEVFGVLGRCYHFTKETGREVLFELRQNQLIEEIPFHGIRILKNDKGNGGGNL